MALQISPACPLKECSASRQRAQARAHVGRSSPCDCERLEEREASSVTSPARSAAPREVERQGVTADDSDGCPKFCRQLGQLDTLTTGTCFPPIQIY